MPSACASNSVKYNTGISLPFLIRLYLQSGQAVTSISAPFSFALETTFWLFSFARDFVKNAITVSQLSKAMELGQLGLQVVLHSERAFEH